MPQDGADRDSPEGRDQLLPPQLIYGVDIGARRIAIAGPDFTLAALDLRAPRTGMHRWTSKPEVHFLGGFLEAVIPPHATVWIENPVVQHGPAANIGTAIRMGMTVGALFARHAGPGYIIDQATWKAALLGNGHASKDEITAWLWAESPGDAEACNGDQDLVDACCIRRYGELVATARLEEPWAVPRGGRRGAVRARKRAADAAGAGSRGA